MNCSELITLISSIFTAISAISAAIACFLTFKNTRPKIKLTPSKRQHNRIYTSYGEKSFAVLGLEIKNKSQISGMIDDICLIYNHKKYFAEDIFTDFDTYPLDIRSRFENAIEQNNSMMRLKCPITVSGFSVLWGYLIFPTFPAIQNSSITVRIRFSLPNKYFKRITRRFTFVQAFPETPKESQQQKYDCTQISDSGDCQKDSA